MKAVSIACCVFLSHCRERPLEQGYLKDKVCSSWLAPVESASEYYYQLFVCWTIMGEYTIFIARYVCIFWINIEETAIFISSVNIYFGFAALLFLLYHIQILFCFLSYLAVSHLRVHRTKSHSSTRLGLHL